LQTLQNDLTGPVATAVSVLALFAAGAALVFGEELGISCGARSCSSSRSRFSCSATTS